MGAPNDGRVGLSARTRESGGTARTLAGSVRCDGFDYTPSRDRASAFLVLQPFRLLPGLTLVLGRPRIAGPGALHRHTLGHAGARDEAERVW